MRKGSDYEFISIDGENIQREITQTYEGLTGRIVRPASPEMLFIQWVTAMRVQFCTNVNVVGNQNLPSRAEGENLDALGELYYAKERPEAKPASVQMLFTISEARGSAIIIPAGTRVSTADGAITFYTEDDAYIPAGDLEVEVRCICETSGTSGNGYAPGTIDICVDPFPYYSSCVNIDESGSGSDAATDDEYYELMVASEDAYSCAGAKGAYEYFAKSVSTDISDVLVTSPEPGQINIYILMNDGKLAGEEIKRAVLEKCSADEMRPLTDYVVVDDPDVVEFDVDIKYFISEDAADSASAIEAAVKKAIDEYVDWQCGKIGRDINPSKLIQMVVAAGAKRVEVTSPVFTRLVTGGDHVKPQLAQAGEIAVTNGGYEDE